MNLPLFFAGRYLFAKKSHGVINTISLISATGMAVGTAALIIILSVYNGFNLLVDSTMGTVEPDILVSPEKGKYFLPDEQAVEEIGHLPQVASVSRVLSESIYLSYEGENGIATAKGVDEVYEEVSPIKGRIVEGNFQLQRGEVPLCSVGLTLAHKMGISPRFLGGIELWYPAAGRQFSASNPAASLEKIKIWPSSLFSINSSIDAELLILPIGQMRRLLSLGEEVSALEIRLNEGSGQAELRSTMDSVRKLLGPGLKVRDRFAQNENLYKMMRYEKAAVFLILLFIIVIVAFNIFGSLTMLIIEKEGDIRTLRSLGADSSLLRRVFITEGWLISLLGLAVGAAVGILVCLIQQKTGIVKMPGSFIMDSYPVVLKARDVLLTVIGVGAVGYLFALLPAQRGRI